MTSERRTGKRPRDHGGSGWADVSINRTDNECQRSPASSQRWERQGRALPWCLRRKPASPHFSPQSCESRCPACGTWSRQRCETNTTPCFQFLELPQLPPNSPPRHLLFPPPGTPFQLPIPSQFFGCPIPMSPIQPCLRSQVR